MTTSLDEYVLAITTESAKIQETRIRTLLRPKPRLLPAFAWRWVLAHLLIIETENL